MIQKIMFSFVFSKKLLIPFDMISHKVGKYYYLILFYLCLLNVINENQIGFSTREVKKDEGALKITLQKKLLKKIKIVGGLNAYEYYFVYGKRISKRAKYFFTKIEKRPN